MGMLSSLFRPSELFALLKYQLRKSSSRDLKNASLDTSRESYKVCYEFLNQTSRSFAPVICTLDDRVKHAVCIFYLVLRALDTVEDDMSIPLSVKVPMLRSFYLNLQDPDWKYTDSTEKDKAVLEEFPLISSEFRKLPSSFQEVISDICEKMGAGMAESLNRSISTLQHWDKYCHYVAGLVGIGLSRLFATSGVESEDLAGEVDLSNSMGLFLQKTNIIRDYLEDVTDNRHFWPKQVWMKYADSLDDLKFPCNRDKAVNCLNELVTNALQHLPDCIKYLTMINNQSVFKFCAIPQVMAIATLERCYNNPAVFTGVVKIRKGEAVKLMMETTDIESVKAIMYTYMTKILNKLGTDDVTNSDVTRATITHAITECKTTTTFTEDSEYVSLYVSLFVLLYAVMSYYWTLLGPFKAVLS